MHRARDVAHLQADLDADLVVEIDERLDLELQADVEIAHRFGDEAARGGGGGGDHRHAVADVDLGFLLVLHPDARVGEHVGRAVLLAQREDEERIGEGEAHQVRVAADPFRQAEHAGRAAGDGDAAARRGRGGAAADEAQRDRAGIAQAELEQAVVADFDDLDLEQHLGLGEVLGGDQALGEAHRVRRVLQHDQVQLLVEEDVARLHQRADHVRRLLHVCVCDVESLHHQLLVLAQLLRRVGVDEHRGLVDDLLLELVAHQDEAHHLLEVLVAHRERAALIGAHVLVEHEAHAGGALKDVEHRAHRHVAQLERDRLVRGGPDAHRREGGLRELLVDHALQALRVALLGVLHQHRPQHVLRLPELLRPHQLLGGREDGAVALIGLERREAGARPGVRRVVALDLQVERLGRLELAGGAQRLGLRQPAGVRRIAHAEVFLAEEAVLGCIGARFLQHLHRVPGAAFVHGLARLADGAVGGAACGEQGREGREQRRVDESHGVFPFSMVSREAHGVSPAASRAGWKWMVILNCASSCASADFLRSKRRPSIEATGILVSTAPAKPRTCA